MKRTLTPEQCDEAIAALQDVAITQAAFWEALTALEGVLGIELDGAEDFTNYEEPGPDDIRDLLATGHCLECGASNDEPHDADCKAAEDWNHGEAKTAPTEAEVSEFNRVYGPKTDEEAQS